MHLVIKNVVIKTFIIINGITINLIINIYTLISWRQLFTTSEEETYWRAHVQLKLSICHQEHISVPIQQCLNFEAPWIVLFKSPNDCYHILWVIYALSSQSCNNIVMNEERSLGLCISWQVEALQHDSQKLLCITFNAKNLVISSFTANVRAVCWW